MADESGSSKISLRKSEQLDEGGHFSRRPGIRISMDGKGWRRDNDFVERVRHSTRCEEAYLRTYEMVSTA